MIDNEIYTLQYTENASLSAIKRDRIDHSLKTHQDFSDEHGKHGNITMFSSASRKKLLRYMARIDRSKLDYAPLFVTLTYGSDYSEDPRECKRHLDNFLKRLAYKFPNSATVWRAEFQKRGALHFHMIVFCVKYICMDWLAKAWNGVVDGDEDHLKAGTSVERSNGYKHTIGYCSKYVAKKTDSRLDDDLKVKEIGRHWGISNREVFYGMLGESKLIDLTEGEYHEVRRYFRRYMDSCQRKKLDREKRKLRDRLRAGTLSQVGYDKCIQYLEIMYKKSKRKVSMSSSSDEYPNASLTVFIQDDFVRKIAKYVKLGDLMGWKMESGNLPRNS